MRFEHSNFAHVEHEHRYSLGKDALVPVCPWNTNAVMVWHALRIRMDAVVTVCTWNTNVAKVWVGLHQDALATVCA